MADGGEKREPRRRRRRPEAARQEPSGPRWAKEAGPKICRKCGGRMYPADWIWQKYGLCVGWRCSKCKEKVMARSLPFKGLRKRTVDPEEIAAAAEPGPEDAPDEREREGRAVREAGRPPAPPRRPPRRKP